MSSTPDATTGGTSPEPTGPPVITSAGQERSLTLTDIFQHDNWEEGLYQVPQSPTPVQGMSRQISCSNTGTLEVRLAAVSGKATVKVAQALDSASSKVTMEFKLLTDQRLIDTKLVKFNQSAALTAPITGVSALTLEVRTAQGSESCDATALVTQFLLSPE